MPVEWYGGDLAHIHDAGFGDFARNAAPGILDLLDRSGVCEGSIVDLGCGSGLLAQELVEAGYRVLGVDISGAMVEIARKRVPEAEFRVASLFEADIPPCAAVTAVGEVLNYIFDPRNDEGALARLFHRVHGALAPGGVLVFDLLEPGQLPPGAATRGFTEGEGWTVLVEREEDPAKKTLTRRIVTFRKAGEHYRRTDETHRVRLYEAVDVTAALRQIGFEVQKMRGYGRHLLSEAHPVYVARKRA